MEIQEHLMKFKFHAILGLIIPISIYVVVSMAPRFADILGYFWPLLASTALFITIVLIVNRVTPPATEGPGERTAEGLLDYVAGPPEAFGLSYNPE